VTVVLEEASLKKGPNLSPKHSILYFHTYHGESPRRLRVKILSDAAA